MSRSTSAGSCEKSASISSTSPAPRSSACAKPARYAGPRPCGAGAVQHLDLVDLGGQPVGDLAGPVGRAVVDDEHAVAVAAAALEHGQHGADDRLDVLGLVVRGQDEPGGSGHGGRPRVEACPTSRTRRSPQYFDELGDLYELDGAVVHRVLAYRNAAKAVRDAPVSVAALTREGKVTSLPGHRQDARGQDQPAARDRDDLRRSSACARSSRPG